MSFMLSQTTQIYVVELWSPNGNERLGRVASSTSLFIANAAFRAAVSHYTDQTVVLSTAGRIIRQSPARGSAAGDARSTARPRGHAVETVDGLPLP